jgi:hypothetical protein
MRRLAGTLLSVLLVLAIGCDPGMTIRQTHSLGAADGTSVAVHVNSSHPLIGETWYAPVVTVTNSSDSPIAVTGVELGAGDVTYANKTRRPGTYPLLVPSGKTEALDTWFDLHDGVKRTFQQSAEIRVHYRRGGKEEIARANLIGADNP